jgi:DNA repair protein RecO (recombination protein O)
MGRPYATEAVVLRSIRFGEADRVLHLMTAERGRVNAIAKGVRRTGSRFGGRLEPLTHAALMLHEGRGELHTVSGADIVRSHAELRGRRQNLAVALIGAEAVLRLNVEPEPRPRAFAGLTRFLDALDAPLAGGRAPRLEPLALAFQLKLLLLAGYLPELSACAGCGAPGPLAAFSPAAGGAACLDCAREPGAFAVAPASLEAMRALVERPLSAAGCGERAARDALRVVEATYAHHGGFRMRTLAERETVPR